MFETAVRELNGVAIGTMSRRELADCVDDLRRLKGAAAALEMRLVCAIDRLGDAGLDGAGVMRSAGRMSSRAAAVVAKTATQLESMPRTSEALAEGRITAEHASAPADLGRARPSHRHPRAVEGTHRSRPRVRRLRGRGVSLRSAPRHRLVGLRTDRHRQPGPVVLPLPSRRPRSADGVGTRRCRRVAGRGPWAPAVPNRRHPAPSRPVGLALQCRDGRRFGGEPRHFTIAPESPGCSSHAS